MAYLIDGNNLIGHRSEFPIRDPRNRYKVVSDLLLFQRIKKVKIILVFDGPPDEDLEDSLSSNHKFSLRFPAQQQNADMIIKEVIANWKNKRQFYVISNDREIKNFTKFHGHTTISCAEFERELKRMKKKNKMFQEMQKEDSAPSPLEIKHWQEVFDSKRNR